MIQYLQHHEWKIIEKGFHPEHNKISESVFSIGNGRMGQRANFEEQYSGESLQGSYLAGVYYPDKTRVGWWKNGYPEYFAKVLNSVNWIGINVKVDGQTLDLAKVKVSRFQRVLNMKEGYLERSFQATFPSGQKIAVKATRFCSLVHDEIGAIRYSIKPLNFSGLPSGKITLSPYLDFDVVNEDANYDEKFWVEVKTKGRSEYDPVIAKTKKTDFHVCAAMHCELEKNGEQIVIKSSKKRKEKYIGKTINATLNEKDELVLYKYVAVLSSLNHSKRILSKGCENALAYAQEKGFHQLLKDHKDAWAKKWKMSDVTISGDVAAQQGIRFNIFQLNQTYTGEDNRLNIGPKGFTGEKYGGVTYWDTEAYCLPFYLSTSEQKVARQLLVYRHNHLQKAIENAEKLGFKDGAALYPMVTINGEECHNEWEITFEEIHRNGAIAYAIYDYIRYTDDSDYLSDYGLEVLIAISRFWAQRVNWSEHKKEYVMLGVTGPNEFENNVNNNFYTNYIAVWCLKFTIQSLDFVKNKDKKRYKEIIGKTNFNSKKEVKKWKDIVDLMYFPRDEKQGIYLQQDGFLDKEQILVKDLDPNELPIVQNWSWDRILRSVFIKQADTLQAFYFFEDDFNEKSHRKHYNYYEPRTVHESSLSPCVHSILAAKLGYEDRAYQFYLRTARLDLDNYNNDSDDGCHITSMAGAWMSIVKGFAGMRVRKGALHFKPFVPKKWKGYSFKIKFRERLLLIEVKPKSVKISKLAGEQLTVKVWGKKYAIDKMVTVKR